MKFRTKMKKFLVYLAGAILVSTNGVLIPVASCRSRTLEQSRHLLELRNRIGGELHGDIDMDEKANEVRVRVGGAMFHTTTELAGIDLRESVTNNDVTGELYAWKVAWDEGDLEALKSIFSQLDNDRQGRVYIEWLLAWKLGASSKDNGALGRVRTAFWVWAKGSVNFMKVGNVANVFPAERELQKK